MGKCELQNTPQTNHKREQPLSKKQPFIPTEIISSVDRCDLHSNQVAREFVALIESGYKLKFSSVGGDPASKLKKLFGKGLKPKHKIELFGTDFYFSNVRQMPELRFFVCFVVQGKSVFPRIVYKDLSLAWRSASHFTYLQDDIWIGKGDVYDGILDGEEVELSNESTTDLPIEMQTAVERLLGWSNKPGSGNGVLEMILRKSPAERVHPYQDFLKQRKAAQANRKNLINGGRPVARFKKPNDPQSLVLAKGYEPDFKNGVVERSQSRSKLYGGTLNRFRILSNNKKIQYYFIAGKSHVWLYPMQALTTELSCFGVRTIDVEADEDLFLPGYEYHHFEETKNGPELYSQIPPGFAGEVCPVDEHKADASPWLEKIPLITQFRKAIKF